MKLDARVDHLKTIKAHLEAAPGEAILDAIAARKDADDGKPT